MGNILFECFEHISEHTIISFGSEATIIIDKFTIWKFKIKMLLVFMDLWNIEDGSEEPSPSNADPKV